jgi:AcrR family transcriptional regulator
MDMSIPYVATGRTGQKRRTRDALIEAARALVRLGTTPTVEQAAAEASISRTTAYRYFQNQRELLVAAHPEIDMPTMLPDDAPADPAARLEIVLDAQLAITVENEAALRTAFRLSLDEHDEDAPLLRRGRAIAWIEEALAPLRSRLSDAEVGRLARAIRASAGIEALIWLCDVGGLSRPEAVELMKWSARALLAAARKSPKPPPRRPSGGLQSSRAALSGPAPH